MTSRQARMPPIGAAQAPPSEWAAGWRILVCSIVGLYIAVLPLHTLGTLLGSIERDTGWSRGSITFALLLLNLLAIVINPLMGAVIDRVGARRVALAGVALFGTAVALLGTAGGSIYGWWARALLVGITLSSVTSTVWITATAAYFRIHRGLAIAICLIGSGIGAGTLPLIATELDHALGWRETYFVLGGAAIVIGLPLLYFWFHERSPDALAGDAEATAEAMAGLSRREVFTSRHYWQLAAGAFLAVVGLVGMSVHMVPVLREAGISPELAAALAAFLGLGAIAGRLTGGFLVDRFFGPIIGCVMLCLPLIACVILALANVVPVTAWLVALLIGLGLGAELDIMAYLAARYFGRRHYGLVLGSLVGIVSFGSGVGPWFGGAIHDSTGGYTLFFWVLSGTFALAALLVLSMGSYPDFKIATKAFPQDPSSGP